GPFSTVIEFYLALRNNVTLKSLKLQSPNALSPALLDIKQLITFYKSVVRLLVLTHSNLSSFNVLIYNNKVVSIIN
ncbi:hypothetical protein BCR34DRAFT_499591, partial [Clohesyomyces aquaticus]